jgi:hypothetical protein
MSKLFGLNLYRERVSVGNVTAPTGLPVDVVAVGHLFPAIMSLNFDL